MLCLTYPQFVVAAPTTLGIHFPGFFAKLLVSINVLNVDFVQILPIGCYQKTNFIQGVMVNTLIPFFVFALVMIAYQVHRFYERRRLDDDDELAQSLNKAKMSYFRFMLILTYFLLPQFSVKIFKIFDCVRP